MSRAGQQLSIPLRVVFYQEDGRWVAHCLEFDLMGDGPSEDAAFEQLNEAIRLQTDASLESDNPQALFHPAGGEIFQMYAAGQHKTLHGELCLRVRSMTIEGVDARTYNAPRIDRDACVA